MSSTHKIKIALVYDAIYPYIKGGGERRFYEFGTRLAKQGFEVHLYGMKLWDGPNIIQKDGIYLHGIMKARPLYNNAGNRTISQALLFGLASFKLLGEKFDVIDCCGFPYFSLFPAKLAAVIKRKPLYATWHEVWGLKYWKEYLGTLGYIGYCVEWLASRLPNTIIATSEHTSRLLQSRLRTKRNIMVIPNGIDTAVMSTIKPSSKKSDVIYVGRLMDFKNIDLLLKSIAHLKDEGKKLSCTIIGEGPDSTRLQNIAKKQHIEKQISWLGFIEDSKDVYAYMKASKVFVQPSKREGFGIVAVEANACGVPVVTTNYADNATKDLIHSDVNGYVSKPTTADLADKISLVLSSADKLSKSSIEQSKMFSWATLSRQLEKVYKS